MKTDSVLLNEKPHKLFEDFLKDYNSLFKINFEKSRKILKDESLWENLTAKWYETLEKKGVKEALKIYNDDYYFIDNFNCYRTYSRHYLKQIISLDDLFSKVKSFVDVGCGLSYSTVALKQLFPKAKGYATNLKNTKLWKFCQIMADKSDFTLIESVDEIGHNVDLVFASEYFEYILTPINHLKDIIDKTNPKILVIANAFNTKSIGHFPHYYHTEGKKEWKIPESKISRMFNKFLTSRGYVKIKTKFWNNRPVIWVKA